MAPGSLRLFCSDRHPCTAARASGSLTSTAKSSAELLKMFEAGRRRIVAKLMDLSPEEWHRPGTHPDYPSYDVHFCIEYMAHHEAHHIYQMFERRAAFAPTPH